jgi:hypothetical protein
LPTRASVDDQPLPYGFNDAAPLIGQLSVEQDLQLHKTARSSVIRFVLDWGAVERSPDHFDFGRADRIYCAATASGIAPLMTVAGVPTWTVEPGLCPEVPCVMPPLDFYLPGLRRFMEVAAERYPAVAAFEAWNEPNFAAFWPDPDPVRYEQLLEEIYRGVKSANSEIPVIGGAVANSSSDDPTTGSLSLHNFLAELLAAGGAKHMDGISIHAYPIGRLGTSTDEFTPQLHIALGFVAMASSNEHPLQLWITETGIPTDPGGFHPPASETEQARQLALIYHTLSRIETVRLVAFHTLLDPPPEVPGGPGFGWFRAADGSTAIPKEVVCSFRSLSGFRDCPDVISLTPR